MKDSAEIEDLLERLTLAEYHGEAYKSEIDKLIAEKDAFAQEMSAKIEAMKAEKMNIADSMSQDIKDLCTSNGRLKEECWNSQGALTKI